MRENSRPKLNIYGKVVLLSVLAGVGMFAIAGSLALAAGFVGIAVVALAVALRRNPGEHERHLTDEESDKTADWEKKAKAEIGGAADGDL